MSISHAPYSPGPRWYVVFHNMLARAWSDTRAEACDYALTLEYRHGIAARVVWCACAADVQAAVVA